MSGATERKTAKRAESPNPGKKADDTKKGEAKDAPKSFMAANGKKIGILSALVAVGFVLKTQFGDKVNMAELMEQAIKFVEAQGSTAVIYYCLFTFIGVVCLVPTTPMEFAGGFLFTPTYGFFMVSLFTGISKLAANIVSVLIAKFVVKDWVMKNVVAKSELLTMVSKAVEEEPWKMAFLVRGSMVPLFVKNYGLGVMNIGYLPNAGCSCIFTNFYAMQNIYMGSTMSDIKDVFSPKKASAGAPAADWLSAATAKKMMPIVINVALVFFLVKAVQAQIKKAKAKIEEDTKKKTDGKKD